jgi:hypothetical protein
MFDSMHVGCTHRSIHVYVYVRIYVENSLAMFICRRTVTTLQVLKNIRHYWC